MVWQSASVGRISGIELENVRLFGTLNLFATFVVGLLFLWIRFRKFYQKYVTYIMADVEIKCLSILNIICLYVI